MLFIDTILLSPIYGTIWAARQVHNAIEQHRAAEPARIAAELSDLCMMLETGRVTEAEFDAREKGLLDQLEQLQEGENNHEEEAASVADKPGAPRARRSSPKTGGKTELQEKGRGPARTLHTAFPTRSKAKEEHDGGQLTSEKNVMLKAAAMVILPMLICLPGAVAEGSSNLTHRLNEQRLAALAMIETGCASEPTCRADRLVGPSGEVSRYQILPAVWRQHHRPPAGGNRPAQSSYRNPVMAKGVAERIMDARAAVFVRATGRAPNDFEWYVLWHKPGAFVRAGYVARRLNPAVQDRAQRFRNLMMSEERLVCTKGP